VTHTRLALENDDFSEFICCLVMALSIIQKRYYLFPKDFDSKELEAHLFVEFLQYKILLSMSDNTHAVNFLLKRNIPKSVWKNPVIQETIKMYLAFREKQYYVFFNIFHELSPHAKKVVLLSGCLPQFQKNAVQIMLKAYRPTIPFAPILHLFSSQNECIGFLTKFGLSFRDAEHTEIETKIGKLV